MKMLSTTNGLAYFPGTPMLEEKQILMILKPGLRIRQLSGRSVTSLSFASWSRNNCSNNILVKAALTISYAAIKNLRIGNFQ
jgi:hypothetical protein